jgi:hypothetical protein
MNYRSIHVFMEKKVENNNNNFAAGGIINHRTHHNSLCRDKNQLSDDLQAMSELSPAPTLVA